MRIPSSVQSLGEALSWATRHRMMSMRALARACGVSAPFMSDVFHDRRKLSEYRIALAAVALDLEPTDLERFVGATRQVMDWLDEHPKVLAKLRKMMRADRIFPAPRKGGPHR